MVPKGFPNVTTSGKQYNIGEKPSVVLYTYYINLHAGTPKPQYFLSKEFRTSVVVIIWSYVVLEKLKLNLTNIISIWVRFMSGKSCVETTSSRTRFDL